MHCRNPKCGGSFHRHIPIEEFEKTQYSNTGWSCFKCGYLKMAIMKSNKSAKDGFVAGFQKNIGKVCNTYTQYKKELKDMGLIELGYEELKTEPEDENFKDYWDDEVLKEIYDEDNINFDGELIRGLQNGSIGLED
jgi:ssDNA-binding Zn-finger/Zn-ribbon topoisomerase 1